MFKVSTQALVNCFMNQRLLQAAPHMSIDVMNSGFIHMLLNDRPNGVIHRI